MADSLAGPDAVVDGAPIPTPMVWFKESSVITGRSVFGTGPNDVWVADATDDIWHSVGDGTWTSRTAERGWRQTGVWGSAPDDVYVSVRANFVFHWNGTGWQKQTDGIAIGLTYEAIWGSGPMDIYMADPSIYHSTGDGKWQGLNIPLGAGPFLSIWGSGPKDVWALGGGGVARWNGQAWRNESTGMMIGATAIWGSGPNDVYAVYGAHVLHTDGTGHWTEQPIPERTRESLLSIWGSGPDDVYVGATASRVFHSRGDGRWSAEVIDTKNSLLGIWGIWGTSAQNIYLVTEAGVYRSRPQNGVDGGS